MAHKRISYERVCPRDFFNESKLLKCLGHLSLKIHEGRLDEYGVEQDLEDPETGFQVERDHINDGLFVDNYRLSIAGREIYLYSAYNRQDPFPLYFTREVDDADRVFTEAGDFTPQFLDFLGTFVRMIVHPEIPDRMVLSNVQLDVGNNFTREHLIRALAQNAPFMIVFDHVRWLDDIEDVEIISTEKLLMPNLSRTVREVFDLRELYEELKGVKPSLGVS